MPTARAMPSSLRRSAASITKIRKISSTPAAIENDPKVVKNDMKALPASSAASSASRFESVASRPSGSTAGRTRARTASLSGTPEVASPRFETSTRLTRPGAPTND